MGDRMEEMWVLEGNILGALEWENQGGETSYPETE